MTTNDPRTRQFERAHEDCRAPWPKGAHIETLRDMRPRWFLVVSTGHKAIRIEVAFCPYCGARATRGTR